MPRDTVGELEHLILLAALSLDDRASALELRRTLTDEGRRLTRGALYRSLDRLTEKGLLDWSTESPTEDRGGHARRLYRVTEAGRAVVLERRATLERLWAGAREVLER